jgi:hypothetical protein
MSENPRGPGPANVPANDAGAPEPAGVDPALRAAISEGLGDRRTGPRLRVEEPCHVLFGPHVLEGVLRNVAADGAMLHGVPGLLAGDTVGLTVPRLSERRFRARVRGVTLLGAHLAMADEAEAAAWQAALGPLVRHLAVPGGA